MATLPDRLTPDEADALLGTVVVHAFAAFALAGELAAPDPDGVYDQDGSAPFLAARAYAVADAMVAEARKRLLAGGEPDTARLEVLATLSAMQPGDVRSIADFNVKRLGTKWRVAPADNARALDIGTPRDHETTAGVILGAAAARQQLRGWGLL